MGGDIGGTLKSVAGATIDPLNISGMGGIPGVNSGGGGLLGEGGLDVMGSGATKSALAAQTAGTAQGNQALTSAYGNSQGYLSPYAQAGNTALSQLSSGQLMDGNQVLQNDPGYQFRLDQGNKAVNQAAAARGMGNSGQTMKALSDYGQNYASGEYNNAYNRQYTNLSNLAGMGANTASTQAGLSQSYGQNMSNNFTGLGNANAAANIAQGNRMSNMVGQGAGIAAMAFCDERLKTDIKPISTTDLDELKACITPYIYKYKDEKHGEGEWIGPMAQDLQKSKLGRTLVVEDENGNLKVDLNKMTTMMFAILGAA